MIGYQVSVDPRQRNAIERLTWNRNLFFVSQHAFQSGHKLPELRGFLWWLRRVFEVITKHNKNYIFLWIPVNDAGERTSNSPLTSMTHLFKKPSGNALVQSWPNIEFITAYYQLLFWSWAGSQIQFFCVDGHIVTLGLLRRFSNFDPEAEIRVPLGISLWLKNGLYLGF